MFIHRSHIDHGKYHSFKHIFSQLKGKENQLSVVSRILDMQDSLQAGYWSMLSTALSDIKLAELPLPAKMADTVTMVTCQLDEPRNRSDNPKKFTAGLAVRLPVRGVIRNLTTSRQLLVQVQSRYVHSQKSFLCLSWLILNFSHV